MSTLVCLTEFLYPQLESSTTSHPKCQLSSPKPRNLNPITPLICWANNSCVYLRKDRDSRLLKIKDIEDLHKLLRYIYTDIKFICSMPVKNSNNTTRLPLKAQLPYFGVNVIPIHGQFNNIIPSSLPPKKIAISTLI